jgi:hypothetical protein
MLPRAVLVQRPTEYEALLARHGTREQARFFLAGNDRTLDEVEQRHVAVEGARRQVLGAIPLDWRRALVGRDELDRFLFEPDDLIVVLGQDGLVADVSKYLDGQPVIGLNRESERWPGVLVTHPPQAAADLMADAAGGRATIAGRTMAQALLDDGQALVALNEVFAGHASHQSASYTLTALGRRERQSSAGLMVTTGTGATGWAASIRGERASTTPLPAPAEPALAFFVREAWPSPATGTELTEGLLTNGAALELQCELESGGVVFGDRIEGDALALDWGSRVRIGVAPKQLRLVA